MPGKCVIGTTKQFAEHADRAVKDITSSYLPVEDVLVVPDDIGVSPRIKENQKFTRLNGSLMSKTFFTFSFLKWLPTKCNQCG